MNKFIKKAVVLSLTALTLFTSLPFSEVKAAEVGPIHTAVATSGKADKLKVTLKVTLDKTTVTDGRVAVEYNPDIFVLENDSEGIKFSDVDVNKAYTNEDAKGIAVAFVNDNAKACKGTLMTLKFSVKPGLSKQDATITTKVFSVNNDDEEVVANTDLQDVVAVGTPKLAKPAIKSVNQTLLGAQVCWKKDANADGYVIYRSTSKDGNYTKIATAKTFSSYLDLAVKNKKTYYYKIVAFKGNGNNRVYSEESAPVSIKIKKLFGLFG